MGDGEEEGGDGELDEPLLVVGSAEWPELPLPSLGGGAVRWGRCWRCKLRIPAALAAPPPASSLFSHKYTFFTLRVVAKPSPRL